MRLNVLPKKGRNRTDSAADARRPQAKRTGKRLAIVGAMALALVGGFAGYTYADDTVPDFFSDPVGAVQATFMKVTGRSGLNEPSWVTDPSTATGWIDDDSGVSTNTGNWNSKTTGRVWTDKTVWEGDATLNNVTGSSDPIVIENDDPNSALVSLSALSSAASITGTEVVTQPLDIVLVLDASSYMDVGTNVVTYEKIDDQVVNSGILHLLPYQCVIKNSAGEYEDIVYVDGSWHLGDANGEIVDLSAQPIYDRKTTETTKLDVLKGSANEFVESVAHMNENLDDTVKHHLSIVQLGAQVSDDNIYEESGTKEETSSTKVLQGLKVVDDTTKGTFTSVINGVQAKGNSSAIDLGMQQAQNVINQGGRGDAKKIVIVFTAGSPRHSWDQNINDMQIADPALEAAASLKDENGTDADIYTVGFFEGADSSVTSSWPNNLLQGISSNYPDAKVDGDAIDLGGRDQTHEYYFNANSAEGLQSVFEALTQAIENNGKTPLENEQVGGTTTPGYIEFTDTLGDFMEVKDFKSVVYAGTEFTNVGSKDNGDGTVTYTFTGTTTGNHVYTAGDLSDIQITVSKSDTAKTGDVVTVRIPASLIPLRYYQAEVNKDSVSTDFSEADAYPIRVFYTVGVKDEVLKSLDTPEDIDGLLDVISDDKATFITNQYASGSNGTTTAEFTPAKDNGFYYFNDENGTVIYSSPDLNPDSRVTKDTLDKSETYYYALEWFDKGGTWHTDAMQISPNSPVLDKLIEQEGGYLAVPMGTERYSRAQDFESPKTENKTQTASNAISPSWGEDGTVTVSLGNNGKVTHTVPGNLDISKTVVWGNGTPNADTLFTFKVDIAGEDTVVPGDFTYTIYEGEGADNPVEGGTGTIKDGGTIHLKDGQHVVIEDIPGGLTYTVTETVPAGFTTNHTETTDEETKVTTSAATGTITSRQTSDVDFTNTYTLQEVTLEGDPNLKVTKTIDGRAWVEGDTFDFTLTPNMEDTTTSQAVTDSAIKFGTAAVTANSKLEVAVESGDQQGDTAASRSDFFGNITFTKPGTYQFVVQEVVPSDAENNVKDGITYTTDEKIVTVTVKDNGDGTMTPTVSGDALAFTNTYKATGKLENVAGTKTITGREFKQGDSFTFNVTGSATALDGGTFTGTVPMPNNKNSVTISPESGASAAVNFGTITFTQEGIYTYTFKEQAPEGATEDNNWTVNGITYDVAAKTIEVKVEDVDHNGTFKVTVTNPAGGNVAGALAWKNAYEASPNTGVIGGTKTLTGRDWLKDETYDFKLEPNDDMTVSAVKGGKIDGFTVENDTIEPLQLKNPVSANGAFSFPELTFRETGDYQFKITEVMPNGASADNKWTVNGVTYDSHTAIVNVTVTDPGDGKLKVEVTPSTEEGQGAAFANSYEVAPLDYTLNLSGTKKVDDQVGTYELKADTFKFVLTPDDAAYPLPTGEGVTRVDKDDASKGVYVTNKAPEGTTDEAAFQLAGTITFTKEGTYTYTLTEDKTSQPGITFDQSVYHIAVAVEEDPATGTLKVTGVTVTKGDGDEAITGGASKLDFTNTYSAGSVEGTISAAKNLSGRNFKPENLGGDAFTFAVKVSGKDAGGAVMTAAQLPKPANTEVTEGEGFYSYNYALTVTSDRTGNSGTTTFSPVSVTYTRPGTYTFEISENDPTDTNITKDGTVYTVTVVVEEQAGQDGEPVLAVTSTTVKAGDTAAESGVVFNNTYKASDTHSVKITKQLSGRAWDDDDEFTFTLKASDDATKTAVKDGTVILPGVEDPTDGDEPASITIAKADAVENVYAKSFENITFNKTGTYKFLVQEQAPEGAQGDVYQGVNYDTNTRLVTITVSHDYQGGFEIKQKVTTQDGNGGAFLTFNNRYDASDAKLDDLAVTKTLTGREWLQGDEFSFELAVDADKDTDDATAAAIENGNIDLPGSGTNDTVTLKINSASTQAGDGTASKTATFGGITFKTEGTFYFKLTETAHSIEGVSHDDAVKYIKVEVEDNGDGQLIATSTVTDDNGEATTLTFTNTYTAKGFTTSFDVQKTFPAAAWNDDTDEWTGRDWTDSDTFQYKLALKSGDADGVQIANEGTSELRKPQSGTVGSGKLANVTFTKAGEYTFEVTETQPDQAAGVAYDTHTATITVKVEHDYANGTFKIAEGYPQYENADAAAGDIATTDAAAFTNVYEPTTGTATLSVKKDLAGRDWDADDSFTFTLAPNDTTTQDAIAAGKIVLPQDATNGITVTDETKEYTDSFGAITFKAPGDYQFKITETVPADTDGVTYPTSPSIVNVNVRDNGEGQLLATVAEGEQTTTVTNMYGASGSLAGGIKVSKTLTGRDNDEWLSTDSFTFSIAPENDAAEQAVENQLIVLPNDVTIGAQTTNHTAEFGKISFGDVEDGTYTFTVTENAVAADSGITAGGESYTVSIRVTDESGDGTLKVELLNESGDAAVAERTLAFTNTYKAAGTLADGSITVEKVLTGRDWTGSDSFEFELTPKSDNAQAAVKDGSIKLPKNATDGITITSGNNHQASFGAITFDDVADGDYVFTVTETSKSGDGITYAEAQEVTITVEDNDAGTLTLTPETTKLTFTNTYNASSEGDAAAKIDATKTLTGRDMKAGEFDFEVRTNPTGEGAAEPVLVATGTNAAGADGTAAKVTFKGVDDKGADKALTFDLASLAQAVEDGYATEGTNADGQRQWTLSYTATEKTDTDVFKKGVSPVKDATSFDFELVVTDDGQGTLTVTANETTLAFKNAYRAAGTLAGAKLPVEKKLTGRDWTADDAFRFQIEAVSATKLDGTTNLSITAPLPTKTTINTKDDAFKADKDDATTHLGNFGDITYSLPGIYTYTISEIAPNPANGITPDTNKTQVVVTVRDNGDGTLTPSVAMYKLEGDVAGATVSAARFANVYDATDATETIDIQKTLTGRNWAVDDAFTFTVTRTTDGAPMPGGATEGSVEVTVKPDAADAENPVTGESAAITFAKDDLGGAMSKKFIYTVTENATSNGVTEDSHTATVTITVTDDGEGKLSASATYDNDAEGATDLDKKVTSAAAFTNTYKATGTFDGIEVTKALEGRSWTDDDSFAFAIEADPASKATVDAVKSGAIELPQNVTVTSKTVDKTATFGDITFNDVADGDYTFIVSEVEPADAADKIAGVTYDDTTYTITLTVADDGEGTLDVSVADDSATTLGRVLEFTNTYKATGTLAGDTIKVKKNLTGRSLQDGDAFAFEIALDTDDLAEGVADAIKLPASPITVTRDSTDATEAFGAISFTDTPDGEYTFTVREVIPDAATNPKVDDGKTTYENATEEQKAQSGWQLEGVTYASAPQTVTVTVKDDGAGKLDVALKDGGQTATLTFANSYTAKPYVLNGSTDLKVSKTLSGSRAWGEDEGYTIELAAKNNAPMPAGATDGTATLTLGKPDTGKTATGHFDSITFDRTGTYTYIITETVDADADEDPDTAGVQIDGVTYSQATYEVTVTVTDEGHDGQLDATVSMKQVKNDAGAATGTTVASKTASFTNAYATEPLVLKAETDLGLAGTKTMDGRDFQAKDTFTFRITKADGTTVDPSKTEVTITPTSGKSANLTFGADTTFTFSEAGTYVYYIAEDNPNVAEGGEGLPGVSYDPLQYRLTIKVKDNGTGKMVLDGNPVLEHQKTAGSSTYKKASSLTFENVYSADSRNLALRATKTLTGDTLKADEFTFTLTPMGSRTAGSSDAFTDDTTQPMPKNDGGTVNDTATNNGDGSITFGSMTFDQTMIGKEFQYKVTEQQPTVDGTYDGAALAGAIKDDRGNWVYQGVTYTHEERLITATVSRAQDEHGNEYVRVTTSGEPASFTNTYATETATFAIPVTKKLENRDSWLSSDTFTFELAATEATQDAIDDDKLAMPAATTAEVGPGAGGHTATFDAITFNEPGDYTFTVSEQVPAKATNVAVDNGSTAYEDATPEQQAKSGWQLNGITYDNEPQTVTVTVTDDGDGTMTAALAKTSTAPVFTNTYDAAPTSAAFTVQKSLDGRAWRTGEAYSFTLENTGAPEGVTAPMPADATIEIGKPASGTVNTAAFDALTFSATGTYTYEISENVPTGDDADATMDYDTHTATVTVYVFEMQSTGKLQAIVSYNNDVADTDTAPDADDKLITNRAAFTNAQRLSTSIELEGAKTIEGRAFQAGDAFTFAVTAADGAPLPSNVKTAEPGDATGTVTIEPTSGKSASIDFGTIAFTGEDMGVQTSKTFTYTIAEQDGGASGMSYDTRTRTVTIQVDNDGDGHLTAMLLSDRADLTWNNRWDFVAGEAFSLTGTKTLTGAELTEGQFAFRVEPVDDAPVVASPVENGAAAYDEDTDTWTAPIELFDEVAFDDQGDYAYLVTEIDRNEGGYTYDDAQYRVTIHVAQNGSTSYTVERSDDGTDWTDAEDNAVTFANKYEVSGTATLVGETDLAGTKTLDGRDWRDTDEFTFVLAAGDDATQAAIDGDADAGVEPTVTMPAETSVTLAGGYSDGAKVPFHFGDITFAVEGDYTFTIAEQQPGTEGFAGNTGGMAYDDHVRTIAVQVRDNGRGGLVATVAKDGTSGSTDWVNEYTTGTATLKGATDLVVAKQIANRDWLDDDAFTFTLAAGDKDTEQAIADKVVTMPDELELTIDDATVDADGEHAAHFGDITFTAVGNYTFTVAETDESHDGLVYDTEPRTVEVEVADDGDGDLTARVTRVAPDAGLTFTNTYGTSGTGDLASLGAFTKVLAGRAWNEDDTFTFELKATGGKAADDALIDAADVPMPADDTVTVGIDDVAAKPDADGNDYATFSFGAIEYAAEGTYTYEVREVAGGNAGIEYSGTVATVTVAVTDDLHGGLSAAVVDIEQPAFTNTYGTQLDYVAEGNLSIVKRLTGHAIADGQFEFTVTAGDDKAAAKAGFTKDEGLTRVYPVGAAAMDDAGTATAVIPLFDDMTFDHTEDEGVYTYTVTESMGGDTEHGYTNDATEYTVTIEVADDANGTLTVTTTVDDADPATEPAVYAYTNGEDAGEPAQVVFDNAYDASGSATIVASKQLTNGALEAGDFSFRVDNEAAGATVAMAPNAADGSIDFGEISYTIDGLIADKQAGACDYDAQDGTYTYTYRVWEYSQMPDGVTPVAASFAVRVVVTDNGDGTLDTQVIYPAGSEDGLVFVNAYGTGATAQLAVGGTKTLAKADPSLNPPDIAGDYTFTLTGVDEDGNAAPLPAATEVVNDASGSVSFGTIEYTMANVFGAEAGDEDAAGDEGVAGDEGAAGDEGVDAQVAQRDKTFTYTVTESGSVAGVANDPEPTRTFTVTVIDNGDGTLSIESDETAGAQFAFTNTYGVEPTTSTVTGDVEGGVQITKVLEGVRALAADEFTFAMKDAATGEVVAEGTNDARGNVELGAIEFALPGVYRYTISEVAGDLSGVTYDTTAYVATATVTDDRDGTLSVAWKVTAVGDAAGTALDELTFTNVYEATEPGRVTFGAIKVLDGRKLADGEFTFELRDADGTVLQTATNAADGSVVFDEPIVFDATGDYAFQIAEVLPTDDDADTAGVQHEGVTYDETVYDVSVTVTDDLAGSLVAAVSYGEDGELPSFTNVYEDVDEPDEPDEPGEPGESDEPDEPGEPDAPAGDEGSEGTVGLIPQTGDYTLAAVGGIGALAVALLACGVALRRRSGSR